MAEPEESQEYYASMQYDKGGETKEIDFMSEEFESKVKDIFAKPKSNPKKLPATKRTKNAFGLFSFEQLSEIFNVELFGLNERETEKMLEELKDEWNDMSENERIGFLNANQIKYADGGMIEKYNLHFNYNPSNLSNEDAEKIVEKYTKNWNRNNDFDEVSFYVLGLTKSNADMLVKELKMEDVYNVELDKSRYADGGMMAKAGTFDSKVNAIAKKLEGKPVPAPYRKEYGTRYDKEDAREAASRIVGNMRKMYGE